MARDRVLNWLPPRVIVLPDGCAVVASNELAWVCRRKHQHVKHARTTLLKKRPEVEAEFIPMTFRFQSRDWDGWYLTLAGLEALFAHLNNIPCRFKKDEILGQYRLLFAQAEGDPPEAEPDPAATLLAEVRALGADVTVEDGALCVWGAEGMLTERHYQRLNAHRADIAGLVQAEGDPEEPQGDEEPAPVPGIDVDTGEPDFDEPEPDPEEDLPAPKPEDVEPALDLPEPEPITDPVVRVDGIRVYTNTLDVAALFGKRHANVLQALEEMHCSAQFRELNYQFCSYTPPGSKRPYPSYDMTKDGMMKLVFGFKGRRRPNCRSAISPASTRWKRRCGRWIGPDCRRR
jgi:Rha family phage regulatory protein